MTFSHLLKKTWHLVRPSKTMGSMGILLPRDFKKILERECARADRTGSHIALVSFGIGKQADGIGQLAKLIDYLKKRIRLSDELGWLEGNQVGVLLYHTDADSARRFVTALRDNNSGAISHINHNIFIYPNGKPNNMDPPSEPGQKPNSSGKRKPHVESGQNGALTAEPRTPLRMEGADSQRDAASNGQTDSGNIKTLLLRKPLWKRLFDMAGAAIALAIFFPSCLIVAIYIKWVSPGPVFFKQARIGFGGKVFRMWKFRTMHVDVEQGAHQRLVGDLLKDNDRPMNKLADDPRIIPSGKFLRKFCIDELPQLINVLKGEMSLVGPRPDPVYAIDHYSDWYTARFDALPGMTGLWQVSGKNRLSFQQMMRLDITYARQRSLWLDLKILLITVPAILWNAKYDA